MLSEIKKTIQHHSFSFFIISALFLLAGCKDEAKSSFTADFTYELVDGNHIRFMNQSSGEYYSLDWDFANGEKISTTDKTKTLTIYYPAKGEYNVTLTALDYTGNKKSISKNVSIAKSDLALSFTATVDAVKTNYVNLTNTSTGDYDSFKWIYRDQEVQDQVNAVAYFPLAGSYEIELQVRKGTNTISSKQILKINQDDPNYVPYSTLFWSDEFNTDGAPDPAKWGYDLGTGNGGWGNQELQYYTSRSENVIVQGGVLKIKAIKENYSGSAYTSTRLLSLNKFAFTYGKIEVKTKLPAGIGTWPAVWMLGTNVNTTGWPACGEIDIVEHRGSELNKIFGTLHYPGRSGGNADGNTKIILNATTEFHIYTAEWTSSAIKISVDNQLFHTVVNSSAIPFNHDFFLLINLAMGGTFGGAVDPAFTNTTLEVDYIRVYK